MTRQVRQFGNLFLAKFVLAWLVLVLPIPAYAYVGPGVGLTAIGAVLAFFAAVFFVIVGFVWYPVKRLKQKLQAKRNPTESRTGSDQMDA